ncbi:MAG TPA: MFS transporter [Roseiflexaceae bacterium]
MWNVVLLGIVSLLADVSSEMVYPLIPLFLASVGAGPATLGLIEGSAEMLASLTKVASGRRSDRTGRRKPLALLGYGLSAAGKGILAMAGGWPGILAGRLADRFGKGIRGAPRDALLADSVALDRRGRAFGLHRAMDTAGALIGVLIAYAIIAGVARPTAATYTRVFALSVLPAALGVAVLALVRERTKPQAPGPRPQAPRADAPSTQNAKRKTQNAKRTVLWSSLDRRLKAFLLIALLFTLGNSSNQFLLLRAGQLGQSSGGVILLYGFYNAIYALLSYPAGWLSDRVGRRALLVAGYAIYGLVYLGFGLAQGTAALWPLFGLYGAYTAFTDGVEKALLVDLAPPELKATLIGLHAAIVGVMLLPASLLAGLLWDQVGPAAPFLAGGGVGLLAAIGLWLVLARTKSP